jgi:diacylglycerol kinase (ATP)
MRVAATLGRGLSTRLLRPFTCNSFAGNHFAGSAGDKEASWRLGLPASPSELDAILIFGGDGTVHRHLAQLVKLQLPVLVVPCGSGNDFARALKLRHVRDSMEAWQRFCSHQDNVRQIDLGVISHSPQRDAVAGISTSSLSAEPHSQYFCCVGGVGLDAEIARRANRLPRWIRQHGGYPLSLLPALARFEPLAVTVQASQSDRLGALATRHPGPAIVVAFANAPAYGGGIKIAPHAQLEDGKLDICVVGNMSKARLLRLFPSVYSGRHLGIPEVEYFQAERLRLETEWPTDVYADGEYVCRTPVDVSVQRAALRVIVPLAQAK